MPFRGSQKSKMQEQQHHKGLKTTATKRNLMPDFFSSLLSRHLAPVCLRQRIGVTFGQLGLKRSRQTRRVTSFSRLKKMIFEKRFFGQGQDQKPAEENGGGAFRETRLKEYKIGLNEISLLRAPHGKITYVLNTGHCRDPGGNEVT